MFLKNKYVYLFKEQMYLVVHLCAISAIMCVGRVRGGREKEIPPCQRYSLVLDF